MNGMVGKSRRHIQIGSKTLNILSISNVIINPTEPPQILLAPAATIETHAETTVVTVCVGYGKDEVPSIQWKYNGNILTNGTLSAVTYEVQSTENNLVFIESILTLCNVGVNNTGNYSCTANNSFGDAESTFTLNVKPNRKSCFSVCILFKLSLD